MPEPLTVSIRQTPRLDNFDGLRLLGALLVLFSHQFALSGRWEPRFVGDHSFGNLGVLIFFAISGYLVTLSWHGDPHPGRFLMRRLLRMAPGLLLSTTLTFAVVSALGLNGFPGNPLSALNGSLWTIPLEVYCYLLLLIIALAFSSPALLLLGGLLVALWYTGGQSTSSFLAYFGLFFAVGALLREQPFLRTTKATVIFVAAGTGLLCIDQTVLGLGLIVPPIAIAVGTRSWPVLRRAGRFGDLSYGVYIYAWPVQQLFVHWMGADAKYSTLVIPSLIVTSLLAYASWHLIEQPALRMKPRAQKPVDESSPIN